MYSRWRLGCLTFLLLLGRARADIVPAQSAASLAAKEAAEEQKRRTCSPTSEEEFGRYGRSVIRRQVEYDLKVGEVTAAPDGLRRELTRWMAERTPALRACVPAQALMQVPERLTATVHLFLQGVKPSAAVVLSADPPAPPGRPAVDGKCVERVLLGGPALELRSPIAAARASVGLLYAPFCVIWREYDSPRPASSLGYGRGGARFLMPAAPPAPPPQAGN